jgi:hypothetical protein
MSRRRILAAIAVAVAVLGSSACAERDTTEEQVLELLDATADLSNRFVYAEERSGQKIVVRGLVEDDFRFKARLSVNDKDVLDEVVNDDAMAVRFIDTSALPQFLSDGSSSGASPLQVLGQRRWVLDPAGAPPVGISATEAEYAGIDPVIDALATLGYVRQAITEGEGVERYNAESIDYRPQEDPFPTPQAKSGIDRYDVEAPAFPKADAVAQSGNTEAAFAGIAHFRKLSVYVKDGRVIQVRERIAAEGKVLEKFTDYMKGFTEQSGGGARKQVDEVIERFEGQERAALLLQIFNSLLDRAGRAPVRFRTMIYELRDLGAQVEVGLPSDVAEGDLSNFGVNAIARAQAEAEAASTASATATRSTATRSTADGAPVP